MSTRDDIIEGMARSLWVLAYASYAEDSGESGHRVMISYPGRINEDLDEEIYKLAEVAGEIIDDGRGSGFGQRDHDYTYKTSEEADKLELAIERVLRREFGKNEDATVYTVKVGPEDVEVPDEGEDWDDVAPETPEAAENAAKDLVKLYQELNGVSIVELANRAGLDRADGEEFGSALAQMAVGSGVSWFDDHPRFEIKTPHFECHFDGENLTWNGDTQPLYQNPARGPTRTGERSRFRETMRGHGRSTAVRPRPPAPTLPEPKKRRASVPGHAKDKHARRARKNPGAVERCIVCMEPTHPSDSTDHDICYRCIEKQLFVVGRVDGDRYAVPLEDGDLPDALRELVDLSDAEPASTIDYGVVTARDAGAARLKTPLAGWTLYKRGGEPRDNPAGTAKFPLVCKHCIRAIRELELGRIGTEYEDAVGSTSCPSSPDGKHQPIKSR